MANNSHKSFGLGAKRNSPNTQVKCAKCNNTYDLARNAKCPYCSMHSETEHKKKIANLYSEPGALVAKPKKQFKQPTLPQELKKDTAQSIYLDNPEDVIPNEEESMPSGGLARFFSTTVQPTRVNREVIGAEEDHAPVDLSGFFSGNNKPVENSSDNMNQSIELELADFIATDIGPSYAEVLSYFDSPAPIQEIPAAQPVPPVEKMDVVMDSIKEKPVVTEEPILPINTAPIAETPVAPEVNAIQDPIPSPAETKDIFSTFQSNFNDIFSSSPFDFKPMSIDDFKPMTFGDDDTK